MAGGGHEEHMRRLFLHVRQAAFQNRTEALVGIELAADGDDHALRISRLTGGGVRGDLLRRVVFFGPVRDQSPEKAGDDAQQQRERPGKQTDPFHFYSLLTGGATVRRFFIVLYHLRAGESIVATQFHAAGRLTFSAGCAMMVTAMI